MKRSKLSLILLLLVGVFFYSLDYEIFYYLLLTNTLYLIYFFRKNHFIFLLNFFYLTFILILIPYIFFDIPYHIYTTYINAENTFKVLFYNFIFHNLLLYNIDKFSNIQIKKFHSPSHRISLFSIFILFIFLINIIINGTGFVLINQSYNIDSYGTILFEYSIPFIFILYLSYTSKRQLFLVRILNVLFIIFPLLYGRRLPAVFLTLIFLVFSNYTNISFRKNVLFSFIGLVLIQTIGLVRDFNSIDLSFLNFFISIDENGVMSNNQGGVIVSAVTYLGLLENEVFDFTWRIKSFLGNFSGLILPSSLNIPETYVNFEAMKHANIPGNGGFASTYFYLWGGIPFIFIFGMLLNYVFRNFNKNIWTFTIFIVLIVLFPRWYSYNIFPAFKILFWTLMLVVLKKIKI